MSLLELKKMSTKGHNVFSVSGFTVWNLLHLSQSAFPFALCSIPKKKPKTKKETLFSQVYLALECLKLKRVPHLLICLFIRQLLFDHQLCNRRERAGDPK